MKQNHFALGDTKTVSVEITRPTDTSAYAASDVISESTSAGEEITFTNLAGTPNGAGYITKVKLATDQSANVARYRLHLFSGTPDDATNVNDNAADEIIFADAGSYIGFVDLPTAQTGAGTNTGAVSISSDVRLAYAGTADANIYGILTTRDAFTPASGQKFDIEVIAERN